MATAVAKKKKKSSKVAFRPMDDRILVEPCEGESTTTGGIILPDSAKEKPQRGIVIAAGPGKMLDSGNRGEMGLKVGDEVFYGKYSGTEVEFNENKYVVVRENDVLAVVGQ